jgi:7-keto-8-aminopelargonate synthetase-like enzyme
MPEYLYQENIACKAVLNPAVPGHESGVRLFMTFEHCGAQIEKTVDVIAEFRKSSDQLLGSNQWCH